MAKRWKKQEETYLKRYSAKKHVAELAERFRTDNSTILGKLKELELEALDSVDPAPLEGNPLLEVFQKGLKALHDGKWKQAVDFFQKVIDETDQSDLANRANRYLAVCRDHLPKRAPKQEEDPYLRAVYERNRSNFDEAMALCSAGGRRAKDPRFAYLAASIFAVTEQPEEAVKYLEIAIRLDPASRVQALLDADFEGLRASSEHAHLFSE